VSEVFTPKHHDLTTSIGHIVDVIRERHGLAPLH